MAQISQAVPELASDPADGGAAARRKRTWARRAARLGAGLGPAAVLLLVGARAGHFAASPLPAPLEGLVGDLLRLQFVVSLAASMLAAPMTVAIAACLALLLVRRRWCLAPGAPGWRLRPWLATVLWAALVVLNVFLDINADLGRLYAATVPLVALAFLASLRGRAAARLLPWVFVLAAWLAWAPTPAARALGLPWVAAAATVAGLAPRLLPARHAVGLLLAFGAALQLAAALPDAIPGALLPHGGTLLGEGRAYSFCEMAGRGTLLAAVTSCEGSDVESCRPDHILAYERADLARPRKLSLFDESFYGRMLHLSCTGERVRVGMSFSMIDGQRLSENVAAFDLDHPERATRRLLEAPAGHRILDDPQAGATYYVSEYSNQVAFERRRGAHTERGRFRVGHSSFGSLQTEIDARSEERGSLFFAEWIAGSKIFEVDRETRRTRAAFPVHNGGTHSLAVDDEMGRVFASGLWGVEVIDLRRGRVIARWRTHMGPRLPVIDARHDLVFVTTTFGPDLWVFDRRSTRPLGRLPIGVGARNALLSRDGALFLASNGRRHFYWDTDALARRFGR
jgi:hypothetical protein